MTNLTIQNALLTLEIQELREQILVLKVQRQRKSTDDSKQTRLHWDFRQDQLLLRLVARFGFKNCRDVAAEMKCRSEKQVYFRLRYLLDLFARNSGSQKLSAEWRDFLAGCQIKQM
ncbi:SANT/Myb_domain [Hexamita inflata]|uniref:SANT/Myb domain n=1 Tax=Hexamita inflata TaxID=28002 RepID=A0AA86NIE7_9EUKA|nr:SANT/Myb domain [Hexamita inflata]CAI9965368.1 SANT/Myb domain [Hexamita inflata]